MEGRHDRLRITNEELAMFHNDLSIEVLVLNKTNIIDKYDVDGEVIYLYRYEDNLVGSSKNCIVISDNDIEKDIDTFYKEYFYIRNKNQSFKNYEIKCIKKENALHVTKQLTSMSIEQLAKVVNAKLELKADIIDIKTKLDF